MQVKTTYIPTTTITPEITNTQERIIDKNSESSLKSLSISSDLKAKVHLEDTTGLLLNVLFFPFRIMIMPIFIIITIMELITAIFNICSCGMLNGTLRIPSFSVNEPSDQEIAALQPYVRHRVTEAISADTQIKLLHTLNTYFKFSKEYLINPNGMSNSKFNSLIKIEVDGHSQLFEYKPLTNSATIFENYLNFLEKHATPYSKIKHTFVGLDYSNFLGALKMKIKTDTVEVKLDLTKEYEQPTLTQTFISYLPVSWRPSSLKSIIPKFIWKRTASIEQRKKATDYLYDFSFWPAKTRQACCHHINQGLGGDHLNEYQISLMDIENIVRL